MSITNCMHITAESIFMQERCMCASWTGPERFLKAIAPFREDSVVGVECIFSWYWLADLCKAKGVPLVLGHALYMRAIHWAKTKNDRIA